MPSGLPFKRKQHPDVPTGDAFGIWRAPAFVWWWVWTPNTLDVHCQKCSSCVTLFVKKASNFSQSSEFLFLWEFILSRCTYTLNHFTLIRLSYIIWSLKVFLDSVCAPFAHSLASIWYLLPSPHAWFPGGCCSALYMQTYPPLRGINENSVHNSQHHHNIVHCTFSPGQRLGAQRGPSALKYHESIHLYCQQTSWLSLIPLFGWALIIIVWVSHYRREGEARFDECN